ncbi:MAG: PTS transporter subunit EIIA [Proteobacteria bacterium]|nr:PTS transporter subunit EIIA [Pseudomonadota bacterium]
MTDYPQLMAIVVTFFVLAIASNWFGELFAKARLPLITGFLFTGMLVGPSILNVIHEESLESLVFIDHVSLAMIAYLAGAELHMKELKNRLKGIITITTTQVIATFGFGLVAVLLLRNQISFLQGMPLGTQFAIAMMIGTVLIARSPSSAIAVINEMRAKGPFTQTTLGVTMISDVVVIVFFAVFLSVTVTLERNTPIDVVFLLVLCFTLVFAVAVGFGLGKLLGVILHAKIYQVGKIGMVVTSGYVVFLSAEYVREYSHHHLPFEVFPEPLLICMVVGFTVTNFTKQRKEFAHILEQVGPAVYVSFFTLTGASLELVVLKDTWVIALLLFLVRLVGIFLGCYSGGRIAGDPPLHNKVGWMVYITQAGVALGLVKHVATVFPDWGDAFATTLIAVIIINQILGPPIFRWGLQIVGETHNKPRTEPEPYDGIRDAIVFGLDHSSYLLARQLKSHGWQVKVASRKLDQITAVPDPAGLIHYFEDIDTESLRKLELDKAEAIVAMFMDDEENYQICREATDNFDVKTIIVRLNDPAYLERFQGLTVTVVEPTTAMINLLDHFVRAPVATSIFAGISKNKDVVGLEVRDPEVEGTAIHELRLPFDLVILSIRRGIEILVPHGNTELRLGDWVTMIGSEASLERAALLMDVDFPVHLNMSQEVFLPPIHEEPVHLQHDDSPFEWSNYLDLELMAAKAEPADKQALFRKISELYATSHSVEPAEYEEAFWQHEIEQNTFVGDGFAVPHATTDAVSRTHFGVVTLSKPVEYFKDELVDTVFYMLVPPRDRGNYLKLRAHMANLMHARPDLFSDLREAQSPEDMHRALLDCGCLDDPTADGAFGA